MKNILFLLLIFLSPSLFCQQYTERRDCISGYKGKNSNNIANYYICDSDFNSNGEISLSGNLKNNFLNKFKQNIISNNSSVFIIITNDWNINKFQDTLGNSNGNDSFLYNNNSITNNSIISVAIADKGKKCFEKRQYRILKDIQFTTFGFDNIIGCDGSDADNSVTFNLSSYQNNNLASSYTFSESGNDIANPNSYTISSNKTVSVEITAYTLGTTACSQTYSSDIQLNIGDITANDVNYKLCGSSKNSGDINSLSSGTYFANFDLSTLDNNIAPNATSASQNITSGKIFIRYYESESNAQSDTNSLTESQIRSYRIEGTRLNLEKRIYARAFSTECFSISKINLKVITPKQVSNDLISANICTNPETNEATWNISSIASGIKSVLTNAESYSNLIITDGTGNDVDLSNSTAYKTSNNSLNMLVDLIDNSLGSIEKCTFNGTISGTKLFSPKSDITPSITVTVCAANSKRASFDLQSQDNSIKNSVDLTGTSLSTNSLEVAYFSEANKQDAYLDGNINLNNQIPKTDIQNYQNAIDDKERIIGVVYVNYSSSGINKLCGSRVNINLTVKPTIASVSDLVSCDGSDIFNLKAKAELFALENNLPTSSVKIFEKQNGQGSDLTSETAYRSTNKKVLYIRYNNGCGNFDINFKTVHFKVNKLILGNQLVCPESNNNNIGVKWDLKFPGTIFDDAIQDIQKESSSDAKITYHSSYDNAIKNEIVVGTPSTPSSDIKIDSDEAGKTYFIRTELGSCVSVNKLKLNFGKADKLDSIRYFFECKKTGQALSGGTFTSTSTQFELDEIKKSIKSQGDAINPGANYSVDLYENDMSGQKRKITRVTGFTASSSYTDKYYLTLKTTTKSNDFCPFFSHALNLEVTDPNEYSSPVISETINTCGDGSSGGIFDIDARINIIKNKLTTISNRFFTNIIITGMGANNTRLNLSGKALRQNKEKLHVSMEYNTNGTSCIKKYEITTNVINPYDVDDVRNVLTNLSSCEDTQGSGNAVFDLSSLKNKVIDNLEKKYLNGRNSLGKSDLYLYTNENDALSTLTPIQTGTSPQTNVAGQGLIFKSNNLHLDNTSLSNVNLTNGTATIYAVTPFNLKNLSCGIITSFELNTIQKPNAPSDLVFNSCNSNPDVYEARFNLHYIKPPNTTPSGYTDKLMFFPTNNVNSSAKLPRNYFEVGGFISKERTFSYRIERFTENGDQDFNCASDVSTINLKILQTPHFSENINAFEIPLCTNSRTNVVFDLTSKEDEVKREIYKLDNSKSLGDIKFKYINNTFDLGNVLDSSEIQDITSNKFIASPNTTTLQGVNSFFALPYIEHPISPKNTMYCASSTEINIITHNTPQIINATTIPDIYGCEEFSGFSSFNLNNQDQAISNAFSNEQGVLSNNIYYFNSLANAETKINTQNQITNLNSGLSPLNTIFKNTEPNTQQLGFVYVYNYPSGIRCATSGNFDVNVIGTKATDVTVQKCVDDYSNNRATFNIQNQHANLISGFPSADRSSINVISPEINRDLKFETAYKSKSKGLFYSFDFTKNGTICRANGLLNMEALASAYIPTATIIDDYELCGNSVNNTAKFNLRSKISEISGASLSKIDLIYFENSKNDADAKVNNGTIINLSPGVDDAKSQSYESALASQTIGVVIGTKYVNGNNTIYCGTTTSFDIKIKAKSPLLGISELLNCDGSPIFDIRNKQNDIIDANTSSNLINSDIEIYRTLDEANDISISKDDVSESENHRSNSNPIETLYISVNNDKGCFDIGELKLVSFTPKKLPISDFEGCPLESNPIEENNSFIVDLISKNDEISNNNSEFSVLYFNSLSDAQQNQNPITTLTNYEVKNITRRNPRKTIYTKTSYGSGVSACKYYSNFDIFLNFPNINIESIIECEGNTLDNATFDIATKKNTINGQLASNNSISGIFLKGNYTDDLSNESNYVSGNNTLVISTINTSTSNTNLKCRVNDTIALAVSKKPSFNTPSAYELCGVFANNTAKFNLNSKESEIKGVISPTARVDNISITWYQKGTSNSNNSNTLISNPSAFQSKSTNVFARISGIDNQTKKTCNIDVDLSLISKSASYITPNDFILSCNINNANFNLLQKKNEIINNDPLITDPSEVKIYKTLDEINITASKKIDISSQTAYNSESRLVYLFHNTSCRVKIIELIANTAVKAHQPNGTLFVCNYDGTSNNKANFSIKDSEILRQQPNTFVTYHLNKNDAQSGINQVSDIDYDISRLNFPYTIYARAANSNGCFDVTSFTLDINTPIKSIKPSQSFFSCNNTFELSRELTPIIAKNLTANNFKVKYYKKRIDALNNQNTLTSSVNISPITITEKRNVYARIENNNSGCFKIETIALKFEKYREKLNVSDYTICSDNISERHTYNLARKKADIITQNPSINNNNTNEVRIFRTKEEALGISPSPIDISTETNFIAKNNTKVYLQNNSKCHIYDITLNFKPNVYAYDIANIKSCVNRSGRSNPINLISTKLNILGGQSFSNVFVSYHLSKNDADLGQNPVSGDSKPELLYLKSLPVKIFVRVASKNSSCFATNTFDIEPLEPVKTIPPGSPIGSCEHLFNLPQIVAPIILNKLDPQEHNVSYFYNRFDADRNVNSIRSNEAINNFSIESDIQKIFVRVENKSSKCYSIESALLSSSKSASLPNLSKDVSLEACDYDTNQEETFNLVKIKPLISNTSSNQDFEFFEIPPNSVNSKKIENLNFSVKEPIKKLFVRVTDKGTRCQSIGSFKLKINKIPSVLSTQVTLLQCATNDDSFTLFNLKESEKLFFDKYNNNDISVSYFSNKEQAINGDRAYALPLSFTNTTSTNQTLAVRFENRQKCFITGNLILTVGKSKLADTDARTTEVCDDLEYLNNDADGISYFNLTSQEEVFNKTLNNPDAKYIYTYYNSKLDALLERNVIKNPTRYTNDSSPFKQNIIARIEDVKTNSCVALASLVKLKVNSLPKIELPNTNLFCLEEKNKPQPIGTKLQGNITYLWNNLETKPIITPEKAGTYSVTATNTDTKCVYTSNEYKITFSSLPKSVNIKPSSFSSENFIDIEVINYFGESPFVYTIDNQKNFVTSKRISNISPGSHTIFIKDRNGCGTISKEFFIPGYRDFLTPNGDGINDVWQVFGIKNNPYTKSSVTIFDRHNRKIITYNPNRYDWDGTSNGYKLPSNDYWFVIVFNDENNTIQSFRGHISLKR